MLTLVEIFSEPIDPHYQVKLSTQETYGRAMEAYHRGDIVEAKLLFTEVSASLPSDQPTKNYIKRCNRYLSNGLPEGWDGFERLDEWMS